jgi:hypothetical protein
MRFYILNNFIKKIIPISRIDVQYNLYRLLFWSLFLFAAPVDMARILNTDLDCSKIA